MITIIIITGILAFSLQLWANIALVQKLVKSRITDGFCKNIIDDCHEKFRKELLFELSLTRKSYKEIALCVNKLKNEIAHENELRKRAIRDLRNTLRKEFSISEEKAVELTSSLIPKIPKRSIECNDQT